MSKPEEIDIAAEVKDELGKLKIKMMEFTDTARAEIKAAGDLSEKTKEKVDKLLNDYGEHTARLADLEQKAVRRGGDSQPRAKSLGELVIESDSVKSLMSARRGSARVELELKNITSATSTVGAGVSAGTSIAPADRVIGIIAPPERKLIVRDLLMPGVTDKTAIDYPQEVLFTNAAAPVAEGAVKPKSDITFNMKHAPVQTIATIFKASRQILDDAPALQSYIDGRARYGLSLAEDAQLLSGDGTGVNLFGILPQTTVYAAPTTITGATAIDKLRLAMLQAALALYPPSGIVLHDIDWAAIEMTKDSQGRYIIASPQQATQPRLWGLPVAPTMSIAQNTFLVGAFNIAAQIYDRMTVEVLISTENVDDFERNMVTIRAEERLALAVYRPQAFVAGQIVAS